MLKEKWYHLYEVWHGEVHDVVFPGQFWTGIELVEFVYFYFISDPDLPFISDPEQVLDPDCYEKYIWASYLQII